MKTYHVVECLTIDQNITGSIPGQGTYPGCEFRAWMRGWPIDVYLTHGCFFLSVPPKKEGKMSVGDDKNKIISKNH